MAIHRPPQQRLARSPWRFVVPPLLVAAVAAIGVGVLFLADREEALELDADLCPTSPDDIVHRAVLLLDSRKPAPSDLAVDALRAVSAEMGAGTELAVFAVGADGGAALRPLARLCKPYDSDEAELADAAAHEDCAAPEPSTDRHLDNARRFCARRARLHTRIEDLMALSSEPVPSAFVIEAIEEISLSLADDPRQKSLYVFSDLLPHADWYSHIEVGDGWRFADYLAAREAQNPRLGPRPPPVADLATTLFYVPRRGITDAPGAKAAHLQFWRDYFADLAGRAPRLVELPPARNYAVTPLANRLYAAETAALKRQRLQREREAAARDLEELAQARTELEEMRKRALEEERLLEQNTAPAHEEPPAVAEPPSVATAASPLPASPPPTNADADDPPIAALPSPTTAVATCVANLMPRFTIRPPAYPGRYRVNYGDATITLSYAIDEQGATEDDSVEVVEDSSSATRPAYFDLFADEARDIVERYRYEFDEPSAGACERRQRLTRRFVFQYER